MDRYGWLHDNALAVSRYPAVRVSDRIRSGRGWFAPGVQDPSANGSVEGWLSDMVTVPVYPEGVRSG